jgi:hypothetical protein
LFSRPALRVVAASQKDAAEPWKVTVAKYRGEDLGLRFEDAAVSPAATHTIEGMSVDAENLSTEARQHAKLDPFQAQSQGRVEVGGSVKAFPLAADLKLAVKTLELLPAATVLYRAAEHRGHAWAGDAEWRRPVASGRQGRRSTRAKLSGGFSGQVTVGDFYAVDKINSADFLKWKSLYLATSTCA